jgi:2-haloacid dehalogenase
VSTHPKYVSFDCLGTLINFEITSPTRRLLGDRLTEPQVQAFLRQFWAYRYDQVCGEFYAYEQVLHDAYARTCKKWNLEVNEDAGKQLAAAVLSWEPHDDVPAPLKKLGDNFPLLQAPLPGVRVHARPARRQPRGAPARLLTHALRPDARR